jgi:enterochelin esterase-like enzyme
MPVMLDNLIYQKRIPSIVAVLLSPGPGGQRSIEYDTVSDRYVNFVETEVLPRITREYQVAFTTDPEGRAAFGQSSGAAAALTMAWLHPNLYRRVISYSGTFVALQRNATAPNGAWDFHQTFIPNSERKPLRIWLHVSENDLGATSPAEQMRNWVIANNRMAAASESQGLPVPVRVFRSVRPRRPRRGDADDARSVRMGVEGLQTGRAVVIAHVTAGVQRSVRVKSTDATSATNGSLNAMTARCCGWR